MRYVARPRSHYRTAWDEEAPIESRQAQINVIEEDSDGFSGLYDLSGNPLYREKDPIGFRIK